ncbi:MAG TPA: c-type cytochrome [Caulobacteraceae bacterium]|jgi:cytochrome c oxidase cbb3-type subunit 3
MGGKINPKFAAIAGVVLVALIATGAFAFHQKQLSDRLVLTAADEVPGDPTLVRYAHQVAGPTYAKACASCHGADMKGDQKLGASNLTDRVWLYDSGNVSDIERTILYGIRSGHAKARNITDMPAVGRLGVLKDAEIRDVIEYVEELSNQPHDAAAAARGVALFKDRGNCFDCHAPDGTGNPDYGSTDLTANTWTYGGDRNTLFLSIRDGRHGKMDAYIGKLSYTQIRALAVEIYERSHNGTQVASK